jgi:hypothetical protein
MTLEARKYMESITESCGPCDCLPLAALREQYEEIKELKVTCERYVSEGALAHMVDKADLEFADPAFTQAYKEAAQTLQARVQAYDRQMHEEAERRNIIFFVHDPEKRAVVETISYAETNDRLQKAEHDLAPLITMNCPRCLRNWGVAV